MTIRNSQGILPALSRRRVLGKLGASVAMLASPYVVRPASAQSRQIVVRDSGGVFTRAFGETLYKPFQDATGIEVVGVAANLDPLAQVKMIVDTQNYTWDAAILGEPARDQLGAAGYLEEHGLETAEHVRDLPEAYRTPWGVGSNVSATILAYRTEVFGAGKGPVTWADFWNTEAFKGRRSLIRNARYTIEEALIADGVDPAALFPLDVDRAFASLDRIKSNIDVWWTSGAQATQLMTSGEVDLLSTNISRAEDASQSGMPMTVSWEGGFWQVDSWCIMKGTPKADLVREFIQFSCSPEAQAGFPQYVANGPVNPNALELIDPARALLLPTHEDNLRKMTHVNTAWWVENQAAVTERFNTWFLG